MSNQVVRVQGFSKGSLSGIGKEAERAEEVNHRNADIDPDRRYLNLAFKETQNGFYSEYHDIRTALNAQGKESKNAVAFEGMVITSDTAFFEGLGWEKGKPAPSKLLEYFRDSYEWAKTQIGYQGTDKNIISAVVHMDETTPHLQLYYLPITDKWREKVYAKDETGKVLRTAKGVPVQAKGEDGKSLWNRCKDSSAPKHSKVEFWYERGAQHSYRRMQDSYHENIGARYGLERGEIGSDREHTTKQQWQAQQLEKEVAPLKKLQVKALEVEPELSRLAPPGYVAIKKKDFELLQSQAKSFVVNRNEIVEVRNRRQAVSKREQAADQREDDLSKRSDEVEKLGQRNANPLQLLEKAEQERDKWKADCFFYSKQHTNEAAKRRDAESALKALKNDFQNYKIDMQEKTKTLTEGFLERLEGAYRSMVSIVQSVSMLGYNWKGKTPNPYKVEGLSDKQARLIDAVRNYGAEWAEKDGFADLAKSMKNNMGLSTGMERHVKALEPKQRSYEHER